MMNMNGVIPDLSGPTKLLRILLFFGATLGVAAMLSSFMQLEMLGSNFSEAEAESNDLREGMFGLLELVLYVLTVVIFGRWVYRANTNVRSLGADGLRVTPGWAVGYFFVPILHLWKPYQAMKDLWKASQRPSDGREWHDSDTPGILPLWWFLWITTNILAQISSRTMMAAQEVESLRFATQVQIASEVIDIALCLVAASLVARISRAQYTARDRSSSD